MIEERQNLIAMIRSSNNESNADKDHIIFEIAHLRNLTLAKVLFDLGTPIDIKNTKGKYLLVMLFGTGNEKLMWYLFCQNNRELNQEFFEM